MRIKTITADNMAEALRIIRDQLGPEALILGTRKIKTASGQPTLEITAALNEPEPTPPPLPLLESLTLPADTPYLATTKPVPPPSPAPEIPEEQRMAAAMAAHGLSPELAQRLLTALPALRQAGFSAVEGLDMLLGRVLPLKDLPDLLPRGYVHVFVGPTGAGKTTLIARLALQANQSGNAANSVGLLSLDDQKLAGFEPLAIAAEALEEQAYLISNASDMHVAAKELGSRQLILVDTPGLNPYHRHEVVGLARRIQQLGLPPEVPLMVHLVAPAHLHGPALNLLPLAFRPLKPSTLLFTKIDETSHLGPLVDTLASHTLVGGLATNHPAVTQPPVPLNGRWLAEALSVPPRALAADLNEEYA